MWVRSTRWARCARGLALALVFVACGGALDWGHAGGDDADCGIALVQHDHHAHRLTSVPPGQPQPSGHCYICHSLQLLHAALKSRDGRVMVDLESARYRPSDPLFARGAAGFSLSSRAPPSPVQL